MSEVPQMSISMPCPNAYVESILPIAVQANYRHGCNDIMVGWVVPSLRRPLNKQIELGSSKAPHLPRRGRELDVYTIYVVDEM